jgi:hypothetical protein
MKDLNKAAVTSVTEVDAGVLVECETCDASVPLAQRQTMHVTAALR